MCRYFKDILDTGMVSQYLVSDKLRNILEVYGNGGCSFFPVLIEDKKGLEVSGYHGLSIIGRCGLISYSQSERIIEPPRYKGGPSIPYLRGQFPDMSQWDGSDIFSPVDSYFDFVTEKLAQPLLEANLTNVNIIQMIKWKLVRVVQQMQVIITEI